MRSLFADPYGCRRAAWCHPPPPPCRYKSRHLAFCFMVPSHWWPLLIFGGMRVSVLGTPPLTMKLVPLHRTINIPQRCETSLTLFLISSNVNLDSKIFFFFFCWRGIGRGCPYDCNTSTQITSQVAKPHQKCTSIWTPHQSSPIPRP